MYLTENYLLWAIETFGLNKEIISINNGNTIIYGTASELLEKLHSGIITRIE